MQQGQSFLSAKASSKKSRDFWGHHEVWIILMVQQDCPVKSGFVLSFDRAMSWEFYDFFFEWDNSGLDCIVIKFGSNNLFTSILVWTRMKAREKKIKRFYVVSGRYICLQNYRPSMLFWHPKRILEVFARFGRSIILWICSSSKFRRFCQNNI